MSETTTTATTLTAGTLWNAPRDATCPALEGFALTPPNAEEAAQLIREAHESTRERAKAYQTPVTEETLRRSVP